jgi:hypothetical protein
MKDLEKNKSEAKEYFKDLGEQLDQNKKNKEVFEVILKQIGEFNKKHKSEKIGAKTGRIQEEGEIREYVFIRKYTDVPKLKRTESGEYELDKTGDGKIRTVWNTLAKVEIKGPTDNEYKSNIDLEKELKEGKVSYKKKESNRQKNLNEMVKKSSSDWEPINQLNNMMKEDGLNVLIIERDAKPNEKLKENQQKVQRLFVCDRNYPDSNEQFTFRRTIGGDSVNEGALNKACLDISKMYIDDPQSLQKKVSVEGVIEEELADV